MAKKNGTKKVAVKPVAKAAVVRKVKGQLAALIAGTSPTVVPAKKAAPAPTPKAPAAATRDPRLPKVGSTVTRERDGKKHTVTILADGFRYNGKTYTSLSTIANTIAGGSWNGFLFFGLGKKK